MSSTWSSKSCADDSDIVAVFFQQLSTRITCYSSLIGLFVLILTKKVICSMARY